MAELVVGEAADMILREREKEMEEEEEKGGLLLLALPGAAWE